MSNLRAFNLTASSVLLAAGTDPVTLDPSLAPPDKGPPNDVTVELDGLSGGDYILLQAQVDASEVSYEWDGPPNYPTPGLTVIYDASSAVATEFFWVPGAPADKAVPGRVFVENEQGFIDCYKAASVARDLGFTKVMMHINRSHTQALGNTCRIPSSLVDGVLSPTLGRKVWDFQGILISGGWGATAGFPFGGLSSGVDITFDEDCTIQPQTGNLIIQTNFGFLTNDSVGLSGAPDAAFTGPVGGEMTLTDTAANFQSRLVTRKITIAVATSGDNNGTFLITAITPTTITYVNAIGIAEAAAGTYSIPGNSPIVPAPGWGLNLNRGGAATLVINDSDTAPLIARTPGAPFMVVAIGAGSAGLGRPFGSGVSPAPLIDGDGGFNILLSEHVSSFINDNILMDSVGGAFFLKVGPWRQGRNNNASGAHPALGDADTGSTLENSMTFNAMLPVAFGQNNSNSAPITADDTRLEVGLNYVDTAAGDVTVRMPCNASPTLGIRTYIVNIGPNKVICDPFAGANARNSGGVSDVVAEPDVLAFDTASFVSNGGLDGTNIGSWNRLIDRRSSTAPDTVASGAMSVTSLLTKMTTSGAQAYSLADGLYEGQLKTIRCDATDNTGTLTPDTFADGTTASFDAVGETLDLAWYVASGWNIIHNVGAVVIA